MQASGTQAGAAAPGRPATRSEDREASTPTIPEGREVASAAAGDTRQRRKWQGKNAVIEQQNELIDELDEISVNIAQQVLTPRLPFVEVQQGVTMFCIALGCYAITDANMSSMAIAERASACGDR